MLASMMLIDNAGKGSCNFAVAVKASKYWMGWKGKGQDIFHSRGGGHTENERLLFLTHTLIGSCKKFKIHLD